MKPKIENCGLNIQRITPILHKDTRGFLGEIFRHDWDKFLGNFIPKQVLISQSNPGIIRAWHRHIRNQTDLIFVRKGILKICAYDGERNSKSFGQLVEMISNSEKPEIIKIPGNLWHGTKNIGNESSEIIYLINNLYDYENPDEERLDWNDPSIVDPKTQKPFDWNLEKEL